jgi:hypothetical protein
LGRRGSRSIQAKYDSGSVTAELVLLMPSVVMLFALLALVGSLQVANLKLVSQAAQLARAYAIGQSPDKIAGLASELKIRVELGKQSDWLCVTASRLMKTWLLPSLTLTQTQCALEVGN